REKFDELSFRSLPVNGRIKFGGFPQAKAERMPMVPRCDPFAVFADHKAAGHPPERDSLNRLKLIPFGNDDLRFWVVPRCPPLVVWGRCKDLKIVRTRL